MAKTTIRAGRPAGMRGLRAIRRHSCHAHAIHHAAAGWAGAPHGNTKRYRNANHARLRHSINQANQRANRHAKLGPNRQPGGDSLWRAAWQD
jgi:hypothetical protein